MGRLLLFAAIVFAGCGHQHSTVTSRDVIDTVTINNYSFWNNQPGENSVRILCEDHQGEYIGELFHLDTVYVLEKHNPNIIRIRTKEGVEGKVSSSRILEYIEWYASLPNYNREKLMLPDSLWRNLPDSVLKDSILQRIIPGIEIKTSVSHLD